MRTERRLLPPSLYAETARPAVDAPPLEGDTRATVAIVGGGFTGLSCALHLAERGAQAVVLEAHEPGWGASGRNGGQVNPGLKPDPDQIEAAFGADLGRRMVALAWAAPDYVFELVRRLGIDCEARQAGTVRAACTDRNTREVQASFDQGVRRGMPVVFWDAAKAAERTGTPRYRAALFDPRGGHLNPLSYARGLAQAAVRAGARVHGGSPALRISRDGTRWRVATPRGAVSAEQLVLATNGYTDGLWPGLRQTVVPVFSGIVASAPLPGDIARAILPARASVYELGDVTFYYYRLDHAGRLVIGGRCRQAPLEGPAGMAFLARYARRLWPGLEDVRFTHGWNGQIAITADHYPHLHEPAAGVIACLGYNGRGVAMATAMGGQVARRILGAAPDEIDMPLTGLSAFPFRRFWKVGVTARIAYGRLRDALDT